MYITTMVNLFFHFLIFLLILLLILLDFSSNCNHEVFLVFFDFILAFPYIIRESLFEEENVSEKNSKF